MKMRDRKNFQWVNEREGKQDIVSQEIGRGGGPPLRIVRAWGDAVKRAGRSKPSKNRHICINWHDNEPRS